MSRRESSSEALGSPLAGADQQAAESEKSQQATQEPPSVGSSDAPSIIGLNPWSGPWDIWLRLMGLVPRYTEDEPHQQTGRWVEKYLIPGIYREVEGVRLISGPAITEPPFRAREHPWMHAHPDYFREDNDRVVEAKKVRSFKGWGEPGSGGVLGYVAAQCLWHGLVLQLGDVDVPAFCPINEEFRLFRVPYRERIAESLRARIRDWYERHILEEKPPPVDGSEGCSRALQIAYPRGSGWLSPDEQDIALARDLALVKDQITELRAEERRLKNKITARIGDAEGLRGVAKWSEVKEAQVKATTRPAYRRLTLLGD